MMSFSTTLLLIAAAFIFQLIRSSARQTRSLEEYVKTLKEKIERLEKSVDENGSICVAVKHVDLNRMSQLRDDVDHLDVMIRDHTAADAEDKLILIEGMKKINMAVDGRSVIDEEVQEQLHAYLAGADIGPHHAVQEHADPMGYIGHMGF
jgi:hypothetical protein